MTPSSLLPSRRFRRAAVVVVITGAAFGATVVGLHINPLDLYYQLPYVRKLALEMWPPNVALLWTKRGLASSILETLSMAYLATLLGGAIALTLAFFAAANTAPRRWVWMAVRASLAVERALPSFVVLLVLLIAVGIGPFAGMLSLAIGSIGTFGRLFADAIEHVDPGVVDAIKCTGATRLQWIRFGVVPQVTPSLIANLLYAFDVNLRAAIPLGLFGGGGIGFELTLADRTLRYKDMLAYTLLIILLIAAIERVSDLLRRRLFAH